MAFRLPTEGTLEGLAAKPPKGPTPDLSHPSMRAFLAALPAGHGRGAAFETGVRWSPGSATGAIESELRRAGYSHSHPQPTIRRDRHERPAEDR